jgi:hypothetical protein
VRALGMAVFMSLSHIGCAHRWRHEREDLMK